MAFVLEGSADGSHFETLYQRGGVGDWITHDMYATHRLIDRPTDQTTNLATKQYCLTA